MGLRLLLRLVLLRLLFLLLSPVCYLQQAPWRTCFLVKESRL